MAGKIHRRIQTSRTLKHIVMIATPQTYFANSAFLFPCWLRRLHFNQNFSLSTVHFPTSPSFSINAPGISSGVNFTGCKSLDVVSSAIFLFFLKFAGNFVALRPRFHVTSGLGRKCVWSYGAMALWSYRAKM